ncbi:MAG: deoxyribodipyrimidine photo-lyase, partial [Hyphomicrobiales bacterium]
PALTAAVMRGNPIICIYILEESERKRGGASEWWLHQSLSSLEKSLAEIGGTLVLRSGAAGHILDCIISETSADHVFWNRRYDADGMGTDKNLKLSLRAQSVDVSSFKANVLFEPWEIEKNSGGFYKVYTPYKRACLAKGVARGPLAAPDKITSAKTTKSETLDTWKLTPTEPNWAKPIAQSWEPGETGAVEKLVRFLHEGGIDGYTVNRNMPALDGTSQLSPHLAFGEISPYQIWSAATAPDVDAPSGDLETFLSEILWREFSYQLLYFNPQLASENFQARFDAFPWQKNDALLRKWQTGQTGYPIVDAGMRQLWQTGWMHNRVRMIVGSFLVKHLLLDWRHGEKWFWDTLVDADPASNAASWQWIAGSGADAAPYFRVFNPMTQGDKFDKSGDYVRKFVPELKDLPNKHLNSPWEAPECVLQSAGVELGKTYPKPIVDHATARKKALSAFAETKETA